ncbi:unnamed protein product [Parascedosporium putredinis]|uniref:Uncharacterized protein n=1 Tax=Parascedosporium putredinis TaxID=1442378 RepID=A0A9P1H0U0_9PEZI|nr:unnamed protein product [Parascedosporium putredinis]CAI7994272.1 unnamed protein product [Parascedosporium putredinis]
MIIRILTNLRANTQSTPSHPKGSNRCPIRPSRLISLPRRTLPDPPLRHSRIRNMPMCSPRRYADVRAEPV